MLYDNVSPRKMMLAIDRRIEHLDRRIRLREGAPKSLEYDKGERRALKWITSLVKIDHPEFLREVAVNAAESQVTNAESLLRPISKKNDQEDQQDVEASKEGSRHQGRDALLLLDDSEEEIGEVLERHETEKEPACLFRLQA